MATTTDPATAAVAAIDDRPATAAPAAGRDDGRQDAPADDGPDMGIPVPDTVSPPAPGGRAPSEDTDEATQAPPPRPADAPQPPSVDSDGRERADPPDAAPADDVPTGTAAAVIYWRRRDPTLHPAEIATRIGKSERTVRRYWPTPARNGAPRGNGRLTHSLRR
jgi:hypothetical protein